MNHFTEVQDFNALSVADLLAAREQFHFHLLHKPNVVGTAVGRYRIRQSDPWPNSQSPSEPRTVRGTKGPRTLANSEVRPYSWPALLVFVEKWIQPGAGLDPDAFVPEAVYLPDGRRVPICVVQATKGPRPEQTSLKPYPGSLLGGGYPVGCDVQGKEHYASVGCLVTDGHRVYAMTNKHVCGEAGQTIFSVLGGNKSEVGISSSKQLGRRAFRDVYPTWPGEGVYVNADIGLIDIADLNQWTTQVYGAGTIGPVANIDISNLSLRLIGCPVRAYGAAGGEMRGEVCALFYRFKGIGGFEYVADLLIGSQTKVPLGTRPGDSGTLWLVDDPKSIEDKQSLAIQWGGQVLGDGSEQSDFALATFLSTICDALDVDLVRDWNSDNPDYWGAVGHYSIATIATEVIKSGRLKQLMSANLENISYQVDEINKKQMQGLSKLDFVPLADVPDMVWKVGPHKRGGMKSPEHANHFADMDRVVDGHTLLQLCEDPTNVSLAVWRNYYDQVAKQYAEHESRGLLPFRIWQIYQAMVEYVRDGKVEEFVCAAGILSHYVGDSCQPLHISYLFNGDPDRMVEGMVKDPENGGKKKGEVPYGTGVHAAYEDDMVDRHVDKVIGGVTQRAKASTAQLVQGGEGAAIAAVELMRATFGKIAPMDIVNAYGELGDDKPAARGDELWQKFGEATMDIMADGAMCLAHLWDSAWREGDGDKNIKALGKIEQTALSTIYQDPKFLPSKTIDSIGPLLGPSGPTPTAHRTKAKVR